MAVASRCSQLPGAGSEGWRWGWPMGSRLAAVKPSKRAVTSSLEPLPVVELAEPKVPAAGSDFGLWPKSLWTAEHALQSSGPRMVEAEPGLVAVPTDSR